MIPFGPFVLDEETGHLRHGDVERPLRAKSFTVLRELVRRRGRLVTKEELFRACWPDTAVSQTVLRVCISEIRAVLAEDATGSTSIESVGRRGYRLVAKAGELDKDPQPPIGRDRELGALRRAFKRADAGLRQIVFVSGEPGLGKTTVLEHFVEETRAGSRARIGWGQCVELTGGTEPYLPVLGLLGRLCAEDATGVVIAALDRWAPSWLLQMPALVDAARAEALARRVPSPNRDRLLRELGEAIEALAADETLVLVVEDLHWVDFASADALAYLAQRVPPARLLLIGSYRPADLALRDRPLQGITQALVAHRRATDIPLARLTRRDVETYLARRLAGAPIDPELGFNLHERTGGNPLFVTATVDYLLERGVLASPHGRWGLAEPLTGIVPEGLRQLALRQVDRLDPVERRVLDAASLAGFEFAVATAAAASDLRPADVEDVCARLAERTELVSATGVAAWPDGMVSSRYEFRHEIYREVLEGALPPARKRMLHLAVGRRLEAAWGERTGDIAAELAIHFAAAADSERAIPYHMAAANAARSRFAEREAVVHLRAALEHLRDRPDTTERARSELACLLDLGGALVSVRGAASEEVGAVHRRALDLAERLDLPRAQFRAHTALYTVTAMRGDLHRAREVAEDLLATAAKLATPLHGVIGHLSLGIALFNVGEFEPAQHHLSEAHAGWRPDFPSLSLDPCMMTRAMLSLTVLIRGEPEAGAEWSRNSVARAEAIQSPYNLSYATELAGQYSATAGQREEALEHAVRAVALAREHGFVIHEAVGTIVRGWATRDADVLRAGIAQYEGTGAYVATSFFRGLLIEVLLELGQMADARAELATVLDFVERSGEQRHLPELYRLQGECLRRGGGSRGEIRAWFDRARSLARQQGARLWELRAVVSTADFLLSEGAKLGTRELLDESIRLFGEGCDLPDLRRAHALRLAL